MILFCKGGCGQKALSSGWCDSHYTKCSGYKSKLSLMAFKREKQKKKKRIQNGWLPQSEKQLYSLICFICSEKFNRTMTIANKSRKLFVPICDKCIRKKMGSSQRRSHKIRMYNLPFERKSFKTKKLIILTEQNFLCNECKNKFDARSYEIHHIDGNSRNNVRENLDILCRNCHYMTL